MRLIEPTTFTREKRITIAKVHVNAASYFNRKRFSGSSSRSPVELFRIMKRKVVAKCVGSL